MPTPTVLKSSDDRGCMHLHALPALETGMYEMIRLRLLLLPVQQAVCSRQKRGMVSPARRKCRAQTPRAQALWELRDVLKWRPASPCPASAP